MGYRFEILPFSWVLPTDAILDGLSSELTSCFIQQGASSHQSMPMVAPHTLGIIVREAHGLKTLF